MTWAAVAIGLGGLMLLARVAEGPLDDPDPAYQRPGLLDLGELPVAAPLVTGDVPVRGEGTVVFFVRPGHVGPLCEALTGTALDDAPDVVVVVAGPTAPCSADATVVPDAEGRIADAYGLRTPQGGGHAVGYAVVDHAGRIRYRTLDPEVRNLLGEVDTMLQAAT